MRRPVLGVLGALAAAALLEATTCGDLGSGHFTFVGLAAGQLSGPLSVEGVSCGLHGVVVDGTLRSSHVRLILAGDVTVSGDVPGVEAGSAVFNANSDAETASALGTGGYGLLEGAARCPGVPALPPFSAPQGLSAAVGASRSQGCAGYSPEPLLPTATLAVTSPAPGQLALNGGEIGLVGQVEPRGSFLVRGAGIGLIGVGRIDGRSVTGALYYALPGGCLISYPLSAG